jgi:hypothetical protein
LSINLGYGQTQRRPKSDGRTGKYTVAAGATVVVALTTGLYVVTTGL